MAQKCEYKKPIETSCQAFARAMNITDSVECNFALYMMAGQIRCARSSSECFNDRLEKFKNALIGVYTKDVDVRIIRDDIDEYYRTIGA
jgi:hypothetical protein